MIERTYLQGRCRTSPACGEGRIASSDAMRVGASILSGSPTRGALIPILPRKRGRGLVIAWSY